MESRNAKRSIQSKRKHTEKLCLVLRVVPQKEKVDQRASTLKTEYNPSKKPRQSKRTDCRATEKRILE
ncbi:hypothetical protein CEE91_12545 [Lactobacillus crispatus]|nr:hypothetical protein CEE91_12545 [Lactobacillus crispatus]